MNAQIAEREDKSNPLFQYGYIAQHRKRKWMSNLKRLLRFTSSGFNKNFSF